MEDWKWKIEKVLCKRRDGSRDEGKRQGKGHGDGGSGKIGIGDVASESAGVWTRATEALSAAMTKALVAVGSGEAPAAVMATAVTAEVVSVRLVVSTVTALVLLVTEAVAAMAKVAMV
jgi:hypothetical protein